MFFEYLKDTSGKWKVFNNKDHLNIVLNFFPEYFCTAFQGLEL